MCHKQMSMASIFLWSMKWQNWKVYREKCNHRQRMEEKKLRGCERHTSFLRGKKKKWRNKEGKSFCDTDEFFLNLITTWVKAAARLFTDYIRCQLIFVDSLRVIVTGLSIQIDMIRYFWDAIDKDNSCGIFGRDYCLWRKHTHTLTHGWKAKKEDLNLLESNCCLSEKT